MRTAPPALLPLFRSELQARLLALLVLDAPEPLTARTIAERTGAARASLHRELGRLELAGLVEHDRVGRTKRYRAAKDSPVHGPLKELLALTLGVETQLSRRLAELPGLEAAAIFGSWAAGEPTPTSDIDVLVVGEMDRSELLSAVREIETLTGREIDVTAYRGDDFDRRRRAGSGFLSTVLRGPLIPLIGDIETVQ